MLAESYPLKTLKKILKAALKSGLRTIRGQIEWWDREEKIKQVPNFADEATIYPWLNHVLTSLTSDKGPGFRPHFTWALLHAAHFAKHLQTKRISAIEFGVAGGNGLVSLENIAKEVEALIGVDIDVYGFDTGHGLPKPVDYRDLPNLFQEADYSMDQEALKKRLRSAELVIGDVRDTVTEFISSKPAPVGFIAFDLDYYSSTVEALKLLEAPCDVLLPRVHCYFDDITGFTYSERTGERLAISEFNGSHRMRAISPIYGLRYYLPACYANQWWSECMYLAHIFEHPLYGARDGLTTVRQLPLR